MTQPAELLLPFWVNGTLDPAESAMVEAAIEADPALGDEAGVLSRTRAAMQAEHLASPGEFGLARLKRAIAEEQRQPRPRWHLPAIAASVAALVTAGGIYLVAGPMAERGGLYTQASGEPASPSMTVAFRPDATEKEIANLLLSRGLVITDGPSALGLYRLEPAEGVDLQTVIRDFSPGGGLISVVEFQE